MGQSSSQEAIASTASRGTCAKCGGASIAAVPPGRILATSQPSASRRAVITRSSDRSSRSTSRTRGAGAVVTASGVHRPIDSRASAASR